MSNKGFAFGIYKEFLKLNNKDNNSVFKKFTKYLNRNYTEDNIQLSNKPIKRGSTSLVISKMQMKLQSNTTTYLLDWLKFRKTLQIQVRTSKDTKELLTLIHLVVMQKWYSYSGNLFGNFL